MASVHREIVVKRSVGDVWDALADVGALHTRLVRGFVTDCRLEPGARVVAFANGMVARELIVASGGVSSRLNWLLLNSVVGTKLKLINGYGGTGEERIALERGEIEAVSQPWPIIKTELAQWLTDKKISLLVQTGADKNPGLPAVPRMIDLARNDDDGALLGLFSTPSTIGTASAAGLRAW